MTFESTKGKFNQTHLSIVEIDAPTVFAGFGTPLSANGAASTELTTYSFTDYEGLIPRSGVRKCIKSLSETPTKLQSGKGLAIRGTASVQFSDGAGDPNPFAPDVTAAVKAQGTYFSKFDSRNILTNRDCRIINYRLNTDGTVDLSSGQTRHYLVDSLNGTSKGVWTLKLKDELSRVNFGDSVWPLENNSYLRQAIDDVTTTFFVDPNTTYAVNDVVRIGDELSKILTVSSIGTTSASFTVSTRGSNIVLGSTFISSTDKSSHSSGDEIILCGAAEGEKLSDLLYRILVDVGIDASMIPLTDWTSEVDEWLTGITINTLWIEPDSTSDVLTKILTYYMLDMWFDPVARQVRLSAVNVWKQSSLILTEGNEIDFESIKFSKNETLRATRALVVYDKKYLARSESIENYNKGELFTRPELEVDDAYGKSKVKHFEFSYLIGSSAASLLVNRWVNRYINPINYSWVTQERKLNFNVGDIVDLNTSVDVGFDGLPSTTARAQILSIQPKYTSVGREYNVSALTYEPSFADSSEIVITGNPSNIDLYIDYAGAPNVAVTITFIFDGSRLSGNSNTIPAMQAGKFKPGSKIIIIVANGAELMAAAGGGGRGQGIQYLPELSKWKTTPAGSGFNGGVVYDAMGIETEIYLSGTTPSANPVYQTADGYLIAPSGGNGGFNGVYPVGNDAGGVSGDGGDGGDGNNLGSGGGAGGVLDAPDSIQGVRGADGTSDRVTGSFGQDGVANNATAGLSGSGIIKQSAVVTVFGGTTTRFINGRGDN